MVDPVSGQSMCVMFPLQLDAGSDERIMLVSRDEQSCLVVTYKELRACVESAFRCG